MPDRSIDVNVKPYSANRWGACPAINYARNADYPMVICAKNGPASLDFMGNFVRNITLQTSHGPIGGLTYDQRSDHLFVLFINRLVAEVDLNGLEMRRFTPSGPYQLQPQGLSMNSARRELYIPLMDGNRIGVFDLNGSYKDSSPLQRSGATGGVAAGDRNFLR
jgi:hypothetical protein